MKTTATENFTPERITSLLAVLAGVLVALLAAYAEVGIGNTLGAAFLAYTATVIAAAVKTPLHLGKVVTASSRGTVITVVITAIVLIGIAKAFRGLV